MDKNISLEQLGEEYEKNAELQKRFIERCKADIKKAQQAGDRDTVCRLKSDLYKLYEIKREVSETALLLKNYYKGAD